MVAFSGLTTERIDLDRLDELTEFVTRVCLAESGRPFLTQEQLARAFTRPHFDPVRDSLVLRDDSGAIVGVEWLQTSFPFVQSRVQGFVDPDRTGEGIGTAMLEWVADVARSRLDEAPTGARVALGAGVDAKHQPSVELMTGFGMELVRYFLEMRIDFDGEVPAADFAAGMDVSTFRPGVDDEELAMALDDAFRDHYGYVERPLDVILEGYHRRMERDDFDPTLWWIVREDDQIVAANLCEPSVDGDPGIGYVGTLGVRGLWRGRGLARALLYLAFAEFRRRGKRAAALHVDAANPTGAAALYEAVGMRESERFAHFELELRSGEELAVR